MRIEVRSSAIKIAGDVRRIKAALHHLETEMRTRGGQQGLKRVLLGQMHYAAYGDQAAALFSDSLRAILEAKELKKVAVTRDGELLERLDDAATKLANCCEEFSRTCFYIARLKGESLQMADFPWGSRVWDRYKNLLEKYEESASTASAPTRAETGLQRGFVALSVLIFILILSAVAFVGYKALRPTKIPIPVSTTSPSTSNNATGTEARVAPKPVPQDTSTQNLVCQMLGAQIATLDEKKAELSRTISATNRQSANDAPSLDSMSGCAALAIPANDGIDYTKTGACAYHPPRINEGTPDEVKEAIRQMIKIEADACAQQLAQYEQTVDAESSINVSRCEIDWVEARNRAYRLEISSTSNAIATLQIQYRVNSCR